MDRRFCPHCETQLDEATGICPACRWDSLEAPSTAAAGPVTSHAEHARGPEHDRFSAIGNEMVRRLSHGPTTRVKLLMVVGVVAVFDMYGGMDARTQPGMGTHHPAPAVNGAPR